MKFEGIHHVTAITGDAPANVDFYTRLLGLRMVKKTVNQDDPTVYHLFYADERGSAGSDITFFEYPGASRGRAGAGMVHRVSFRVGSPDALAFWRDRLTAEGVEVQEGDGWLRFEDPEEMGLELVVTGAGDEPLVARHPEIPSEHAIQGFDGVRAYAHAPDRSRRLLEEVLEFEPLGDAGWDVRGASRGGTFGYDEPPAAPGIPGAGTVHHIAFAAPLDEHQRWLERLRERGVRSTDVIDRFYFRSIYFREPSGVLFEIASIGPGFATDEPAEHLGERLSLPPNFEHLRSRVEPLLTPLPHPRAGWKAPAG
jgi:glyoxalase family protein